MKRTLKGVVKDVVKAESPKLSKIGEFIKNSKPLIVVYDVKAVNK